MKKIKLLICSLILFSLTSFSQVFFQLDSIRHPNCMSLSGDAYFTVFFQPVPGPILVKGFLIPGLEFETFDALAVLTDDDANGFEHYTYSMSTEGDIRLYFVYPSSSYIDSIDFHFNSHLINISGLFPALTSCSNISGSAIAFSEGTPPYNFYLTENNWQTSTLIGNYPSVDPSDPINVPVALPLGHYQFNLIDSYCEKLYPEPLADFSVWGIGVFEPGYWVCVCPELIGDTTVLDATNIYSRSLTAISAGIYTKWEDTLLITVNYGDGSPLDIYAQTVEQWHTPFEISHTYTSNGIFDVQYEIKNTRVALITSSYSFNTHEYAEVNMVSSHEIIQNTNELEVFPNPVENGLNIILYSENVEPARVNIFNATGQKIIDKEVFLNKEKTEIFIPVDFLSRGIYTLQILTKDKVISRKFVK